jgi:hypothetical protein
MPWRLHFKRKTKATEHTNIGFSFITIACQSKLNQFYNLWRQQAIGRALFFYLFLGFVSPEVPINLQNP